MAHPYHHALSSARSYKTNWEKHFEIHNWIDSSKFAFADARHRSLLHNTSAVALSQLLFENKKIKEIKKIAWQHITEDLGFVPKIQDWLPEKYWNQSLVINKSFDLTNRNTLKKSLLLGNKFPKSLEKKLNKILEILLSPEKNETLKNDSPLRFFFFSSCGPYLCEQILGPIIKSDDSKTTANAVATRSAAEYFVQKTWGKIPSHQDIMSQRPIEDWMWKKARPLSRELD